MTTQTYQGPAGVIFSPQEYLLIWQALALNPTTENAPIRARLKRYLEEGEGDNQ